MKSSIFKHHYLNLVKKVNYLNKSIQSLLMEEPSLDDTKIDDKMIEDYYRKLCKLYDQKFTYKKLQNFLLLYFSRNFKQSS